MRNPRPSIGGELASAYRVTFCTAGGGAERAAGLSGHLVRRSTADGVDESIARSNRTSKARVMAGTGEKVRAGINGVDARIPNSSEFRLPRLAPSTRRCRLCTKRPKERRRQNTEQRIPRQAFRTGRSPTKLPTSPQGRTHVSQQLCHETPSGLPRVNTTPTPANTRPAPRSPRSC